MQPSTSAISGAVLEHKAEGDRAPLGVRQAVDEVAQARAGVEVIHERRLLAYLDRAVPCFMRARGEWEYDTYMGVSGWLVRRDVDDHPESNPEIDDYTRSRGKSPKCDAANPLRRRRRRRVGMIRTATRLGRRVQH